MNTDKHRFYICQRPKDKRPIWTRMNTDNDSEKMPLLLTPYSSRLTAFIGTRIKQQSRK
jgi:hypothetical protein